MTLWEPDSLYYRLSEWTKHLKIKAMIWTEWYRQYQYVPISLMEQHATYKQKKKNYDHLSRSQMIWMLTQNSCEDWDTEQTMKRTDTARLCNNSKPNTLMQNMKMQLNEDEAKSPCFVVCAVSWWKWATPENNMKKCFLPSLHHMWWNVARFNPKSWACTTRTETPGGDYEN